MSLLFAEQPIVINTPLATVIGLNEAIVLQQVHYWVDGNKKRKINLKEGRFWTYNTYDKWQSENFPFWSLSTVERTFKKLEKMGLLISGSFNKKKTDRTKWYTINYEELEKLEKAHEDASRQNDEMQNEAIRQNDEMQNDAFPQNDEMQSVNLTCSIYTENTTETNNKDLKDFVNKTASPTLKNQYLEIANGFYVEMSSGRWSKDQWVNLTNKLIDSIIDSGTEIENPIGYIRACLVNCCYAHDLKHGKIDFEDKTDSTTIPFFNWLIKDMD